MRASAFAPMTATAHRWSPAAPADRETTTPYVRRRRSQQRDVEQRAVGSKRVGAVEALECRLVGGGGLLRRKAFRRHRMNIFRRDRDPRQKRLARHAVIAVGMIVRHEAFVAPEPVHAVPRKARRESPASRGFHKAAAASIRPTGKPRRRGRSPAPDRKAIPRHLAPALRRSRKADLGRAATVIVRQPCARTVAVSNSGDGGRVIAGTEYGRSGDDRVGAGVDRQRGILAVLAAVDLDPRIEPF